MRVLSLVWVGTRTSEYSATVTFFKDVLGLGEHVLEPDFAVLDVPDGATVEVFGPTSEYHRHLTHPVAGFRVDDRRAPSPSWKLPASRSCCHRRTAESGRGCTSALPTGSSMSSWRIAPPDHSRDGGLSITLRG